MAEEKWSPAHPPSSPARQRGAAGRHDRGLHPQRPWGAPCPRTPPRHRLPLPCSHARTGPGCCPVRLSVRRQLPARLSVLRQLPVRLSVRRQLPDRLPVLPARLSVRRQLPARPPVRRQTRCRQRTSGFLLPSAGGPAPVQPGRERGGVSRQLCGEGVP